MDTKITRLEPLLAAVILLAMGLLAGCTSSPTGRSRLILVSPTNVQQMGISAFSQMRKAGKFADAPAERAYASCVANALIQVLPMPWSRQQWDIEIIKDKTVNAFALPGGRIGVNQGMFKVATNQALLAVVLGHELSHVVARHSAERISDQMIAQLGISTATAYGASQGIDPASLQKLLGMGTQLGVMLPFSRAQESEADIMGQRFMARAGFNPQAAVVLWQKMAQQEKSAPLAFLSTHPATRSRIAKMKSQLPKLMPVYQQARRQGHSPNCHL